ncbi:MAG: gliding motility-associated C-terminal domain-containing protein, partial [Flavobacteriales bacterium]|nr:gliding motility-associated C-terminal domain-containing protein [Flavobacteriales bacterium]
FHRPGFLRGCTQTFSITVNSVAGPIVSATATDVSCFGTCDGTGAVVASGGSGSFTFEWNGVPGGTANEINLCAGNHTILVTDAGSGCITSTFIVVSEPDSIAMSLPNIINASCGGLCDGIANVVASGGDLPYTYSWPSGGTGEVDSLLCADTLLVNITDNSGCTQTQEVIITEPTPITIALDSIDASCSSVADGAVNGVVGGGSSGYTHTWVGPTPGIGAIDNDSISNLFSGMYYLTVTDGQGCSMTDSIMVNTTVTVVPYAGLDTSVCAGSGTFTIIGTGTAVSFHWEDVTGAVLSLNDTLIVSTGGCYVLVGTDGLCTNTDTVCVNIYTLPNPDAGANQTVPTGTSTTIGGSPTTDPLFNVLWIPNTYLDNDSIQNPNVVSIDSTTTYIVMVTDTNGCIGYDTVLVDIYPDIFFPTGFTPNGDGINDDWELDYFDQFPDVEIEVYNRWGQQLFYNRGYTQRWDGRYNDKDLPEGTYYYVIKLNHPIFPEPYTGPVTIMR